MTAREAPAFLRDERFAGILQVQGWYYSCALTALLAICLAAISGSRDRDLLVALSAIGTLCALTARGLGRRKRSSRFLSYLLSVPLVPLLVGIALICKVRKASRHGWFSSGPLPPLLVTVHQAELWETIHFRTLDLGAEAVANARRELGIPGFTAEELAALEKLGRSLHLYREKPLPWPLKLTAAALPVGIIPILPGALLLVPSATVVAVAFTVLRGLGRGRWADDLWQTFSSSVVICAVLGVVAQLAFALPLASLAAAVSCAASTVLVVVLLVIGNS
jgi:hypothetical protein